MYELVHSLVFLLPHKQASSSNTCMICVMDSYRDAGATVGQGGGRFEKGTCTNYDVILTSEF